MLLSDEWLNNSIEAYIHSIKPTSQSIYWSILISIICIIIALPFIYIDISIQSYGIIRPITEKTEIKSMITELVDSVYTREGNKIRKGDTILQFRINELTHETNYQNKRLNDCQAHLSDLKILIEGKQPQKFHSQVQKQEYILFNKRKKELETNAKQAKKEFLRNESLFKMKIISEEEYDNSYFKYQNVLNKQESFVENQLSIWKSELNNYQNLLNEIKKSLYNNFETKKMYIVKSPVNGSIDKFSGIYKGSNIHKGDLIAIISPDSSLCIEAMVSPQDIGYIYIEMPVKIQIDSFNYNEWGTITGKVKEISSDFLIDNNNQAYYKIKCNLEKNYLLSQKGKKGYLKKGMTAHIHFMITQCSLFQLLYQKMDDWSNPTRN